MISGGMIRRLFRVGMCLAASVCFCLVSGSPARADLDRDAFNGVMSRLDRDLQRLTASVTTFLQSQGRWAPLPQGNDLQLCNALHALQQQVDRTAQDARSGRPYPIMQQDVMQLQNTGQAVEQLLSMSGATPDVQSRWFNVRSSLVNLNQTLYFNSGGYSWNRVNDFNGPAIAAPATQAVSLAASRIERGVDQLVPAVQVFLTRQGKWPPPAMGPEMQLCSQLQAFQQQVRQFGRDSNSRRQFDILQPQIMQLQASGAGIERMLGVVGATPDVVSRWWGIRNDLVSLNQLFYAGGSRNSGWSRFF